MQIQELLSSTAAFKKINYKGNYCESYNANVAFLYVYLKIFFFGGKEIYKTLNMHLLCGDNLQP